MSTAQPSPWPWVVGLGGVAVAGGVLAWHWKRDTSAPRVGASPSADVDPSFASPDIANAAAASPAAAAGVALDDSPSRPSSTPPSLAVVPPRPVAPSSAAPPSLVSSMPFISAEVAAAAAAAMAVASPPAAAPSPAAPSLVSSMPFVSPEVAAAVAVASPPVVAAPSPATTAAPTLDSPIKIYPLLRWRDYTPRISDGWGSPRDGGDRDHHGADIMYRRRSLTDQIEAFPPKAPHSKWHFMPPGALIVAVADGEVWSVRRSSRGISVTLQHAGGWVTFYQHLSRVFLPFTDHALGKIAVRAGQAIGIVGSSPKEGARGLAHLHFELRRGVNPVDPARWLKIARVLDEPTILPPIEAVLTQPPPVRDPRESAMLAEIYQALGAGIPVAYLAALGRAESGGNARHPKGVLNLTRVAIDEYNRHHPGHLSVSVNELSDPIKAVRVAVWVLREVIASYQAHHADVPTLREDWTNPDFIALVTAGWNAGHSEARGVGRVATYLVMHSMPVTLANVWRYARAAGAASTLSDPNKRRFAERVTADYLRTVGAAS